MALGENSSISVAAQPTLWKAAFIAEEGFMHPIVNAAMGTADRLPYRTHSARVS